jgi:site-specific recombinase XerD
MWIGCGVSSCSTINAIRLRWAPPEIRAFLAHLAQERNVSAPTQNQALSALLFLYREVLHKEIEPVLLSTAKRPQRLPSVLTLLEHLSGTFKLMAQLLYGSGLRRMECVRLRIQDVDFEYKAITVREVITPE